MMWQSLERAIAAHARYDGDLAASLSFPVRVAAPLHMTVRSRPLSLSWRTASCGAAAALAGAMPSAARGQDAPRVILVSVMPSTCGVEPIPLEALRAALQVELGATNAVSIGAPTDARPHLQVRLEPVPCAVGAMSVHVSIRDAEPGPPRESSFSLEGTPRGARLRVIALVVAERLRHGDEAAHATPDPLNEAASAFPSPSPMPPAEPAPEGLPAITVVAPTPAVHPTPAAPVAPRSPRFSLGLDFGARYYFPSRDNNVPAASGRADGGIVFYGPRVHLTYTRGYFFARAGVDGLFTEQTSALGHIDGLLVLGALGAGVQFRGERFVVAAGLRLEGGVGVAWGASPYPNVATSTASGALFGGSVEVPVLSFRVADRTWVSVTPAVGFSLVGIMATEAPGGASSGALAASVYSVGPFVAASVGATYDL